MSHKPQFVGRVTNTRDGRRLRPSPSPHGKPAASEPGRSGRAKDCHGDMVEDYSEDAGEFELVARLDPDEYVVEQEEDGTWLVYRKAASEGNEFTHDAAPHQARIAAINTKNRELWRKRTQEGRYQ